MAKIARNFEPPGLLYFERNLVEIDETSLVCDLVEFDDIAVIKRQETIQTEQKLNHQIDQVIRAKIGSMMKSVPRKWAYKIAKKFLFYVLTLNFDLPISDFKGVVWA